MIHGLFKQPFKMLLVAFLKAVNGMMKEPRKLKIVEKAVPCVYQKLFVLNVKLTNG